MANHSSALSALHKLLIELDDVNNQLARGPRQQKIRETKVSQAEAAHVALKNQLKEFRAATDRKSLDLKSNEAKIANLRGKLNTATNNREYDILRGQIEADEVANSVLEDEILELLDKVDRTQREIHEADLKAKQLRKETDDFTAEFVVKARLLEQQAADLRSKIAESDKFLTGDTGLRYRRLVEAYHSEGLAAMDKNGICTSCYVSLTAQQKVQITNGQLLFCSNCGRLLYSNS